MFKIACYTIGAAGLILALVLWWEGHISGGRLALALSIVLAGVFVGVLAVVLLLAGVFANRFAAALVSAAALAFVLGFIGVFVGTFVSMLAGALAYANWIDTPRAQASEGLKSLIELEHSTMPEECIAFVRWCGEDETVLHYQQQLAAHGRKPTRAEYESAKRWMATSLGWANEQEKDARARQACDRMSMEM